MAPDTCTLRGGQIVAPNNRFWRAKAQALDALIGGMVLSPSVTLQFWCPFSRREMRQLKLSVDNKATGSREWFTLAQLAEAAQSATRESEAAADREDFLRIHEAHMAGLAAVGYRCSALDDNARFCLQPSGLGLQTICRCSVSWLHPFTELRPGYCFIEDGQAHGVVGPWFSPRIPFESFRSEVIARTSAVLLTQWENERAALMRQSP